MKRTDVIDIHGLKPSHFNYDDSGTTLDISMILTYMKHNYEDLILLDMISKDMHPTKTGLRELK